MGVRNTKELDYREGRINRSGNAAQPTGLSNIPGPKAPPKFKTVFPNRISPQVESRVKSIDSANGAWNQVQQGYSAKPPLIMTQAAAPPPPSEESPRLPRQIDENFGEPDVNRLPRQKTSDELISAIEDVTQKNEPVYDRIALNKQNDDTASVTSDPDISYLLKEVEKRARKQRELDYKIKLNERKLSDKYKNLARESKSVKISGPNDAAVDSSQQMKKSVTIADGTTGDEKFRREALMRELAQYDELESRKKIRLDEQEKELRRDGYLAPSTPPQTPPSSSFFSPIPQPQSSPPSYKNSAPPPLKLTPPSTGRTNPSEESDITKTMIVDKPSEIKPHAQENTKPIRTISKPPSLSSTSPKRKTLVIPMDVHNRSKGLNEQELKRIISVIDNFEKQSGPKDACPSRYFLDGKEIYVTHGAIQPQQQIQTQRPATPQQLTPVQPPKLAPQSAPLMPAPPPSQMQVQAPPRSVNLNRVITTTYTKTPCKNVYDDIIDNYTNRYIADKQQQPIYDQSQAAKKLAEIDYYLSLANKNAKAIANSDECCGYRMLNKNAELMKVEWDKELLQVDEAIAIRLRHKHDILQRRSDDSRPKSEFTPKEADMDRSMSQQMSTMRPPSDTKEAIKRTLERRQRESINSPNSRPVTPTTPGAITPTNLAIKRAIQQQRNNSLRTPSTPGTPGGPGFRPLNNLNTPPPPELKRRDSNSSIASRLSHRLKFWDRGHADSTARNILARVKKPVGA